MIKLASGILLIFLLHSCIYKAGNRSQDINYAWETNISPYYIKKYMRTIDPFYANRMLITSEIVNYPETFIPVTDSAAGFKYVIEFNNMDSLASLQLNYFNLSSLYDFHKQKWVKSRDSLKNKELDKFNAFFKDSVLIKVVERYKNKIPDNLLFIDKPDTLVLKPLR